MINADVIAEISFDIAGETEKMTLKFGRPYFIIVDQHWCCPFELNQPLEVSRNIYGEHSLQALLLALKTASSYLYGSNLYRNGKIGIFGDFGGYLNMPAPKEFIDIAPYPF